MAPADYAVKTPQTRCPSGQVFSTGVKAVNPNARLAVISAGSGGKSCSQLLRIGVAVMIPESRGGVELMHDSLHFYPGASLL